MILVVDPDPDARALFAAGLAASGWVADEVIDGREALAKAITCRPAAIVTETRVPRLDGVELCQLLRRDPDTQHIPIVVITSEDEERRLAAAEAAGADRILRKPCQPDELVCAIETILSTPRENGARRDGAGHSAPSKPMARAKFASKRHQRFVTPTPPSQPPSLVCPRCDRPLTYLKSYVGGVSAKFSEQWDHYECQSGCGQFQYRQRTRKLREAS